MRHRGDEKDKQPMAATEEKRTRENSERKKEKMNRRNLLKSSAALGFASALPTLAAGKRRRRTDSGRQGSSDGQDQPAHPSRQGQHSYCLPDLRRNATDRLRRSLGDI